MTAISEPETITSLKDLGISLLIELAQNGEIDPWDVQVIDVIDRYLSKLALATDKDHARRDADLSESGQAFLWASMLVLLKADTLGQQEIGDDIELTDSDELTDNWTQRQLPANLERCLRRRGSGQPPKRRPVTLQELIQQLQEMASAISEKTPRPRLKRPKNQSLAQATRAIAQLAHNENLTEIASELEQFLLCQWSELSQGQEWLNLDQLVAYWSGVKSTDAIEHTKTESTTSTHDRVGVFWALLLLSAQSKVELTQEEFYQEIKIRTFCADEEVNLESLYKSQV